MVVRVLYTVLDIRNVLHYDAIWKVLESYGNYQRNWRKVAEHCPELDGNREKLLETTRIIQAQARLTPTLTHVVTYVLVTSGAEDEQCQYRLEPRLCLGCRFLQSGGWGLL
jgi:hypothetical protein